MSEQIADRIEQFIRQMDDYVSAPSERQLVWKMLDMDNPPQGLAYWVERDERLTKVVEAFVPACKLIAELLESIDADSTPILRLIETKTKLGRSAVEEAWPDVRERLLRIAVRCRAGCASADSPEPVAARRSSDPTRFSRTGPSETARPSDANPKSHQKTSTPVAPLPSWERLVLKQQAGGSDIAKLDGNEYRIGTAAYKMLSALQVNKGNMILANTLQGSIGKRPNEVYESLPQRLQNIIDKPGKSKSGYRLV